MRPLNSAQLRKLIVSIVLVALLGGCDFDPSEIVHSTTVPDPRQTADGVWWYPLPVSGETDEWMWVPTPANCVSGAYVMKPGSHIDVLLSNGKVYRLTKKEFGYEFTGIVDQDVSANPGLVFLTILLLVVFVVVAIAALYHKSEFESAMTQLGCLQKSFFAARDRLYHRKVQVKALVAKAKRDKQILKECRKEDERILHAAQEELERQQKALVVAAKPSPLKIEELTREKYHDLSRAVRHQLFSNEIRSREVFVRYTIDPLRAQGTGWACVFEWELLLDRPSPLRLTVLRDGQLIRREPGSYRGTIPTVLELRKKHRFTFKLYDGKRPFADPLSFEIESPPFEAWNPEPPKPPERKTPEQLRKERDVWVQQEHKRLAGLITDPEQLKIKKAEIDQEALRKFGEAP